jgi:hypothetical protein
MLNLLMISERKRNSEAGWVLTRANVQKGPFKSLGRSRVVVDKTLDPTFRVDSLSTQSHMLHDQHRRRFQFAIVLNGEVVKLKEFSMIPSLGAHRRGDSRFLNAAAFE